MWIFFGCVFLSAYLISSSLPLCLTHIHFPPSGKDIEYHLFIPDWFKNNVRVCFEWAPTSGFLHDANQCAQHQGGSNDSGIDSLNTGPLARPFARSLAPLTRELAPDCSLRSRPPLRSLVHSLAHFAHSLARGKVNF